MQFGHVSIEEAEGAVLVHSFVLSTGRIAKGRVLSPSDIASFRADAIAAVTVARLDPDDIAEDAAALRVADAVAGPGIDIEIAVGGRINLIARHYGVITYDRAWLDALNGVNEAITLAALPPFSAVEPGQMVGTAKIIPFAVPDPVLCQAEAAAQRGTFGVASTQPRQIGLIQTTLPGTTPKLLEKTTGVTRHRVEALGSDLVRDDRCAHDVAALAAAIQAQISDGVEMVLVVGASAVTDRRDVIPAAIEQASGTVDHFGMPVDPGNLMLLGHVGAVPVLGVPGCARSPKRNGFDWVLERLACGLTLASTDFALMGAGGLLKEIGGRPMPRATAARPSETDTYVIYTLVLAAGGHAEILAAPDGVANVGKVVRAAKNSAARGTYVVTGADEDAVVAAVHEHGVSYAYNPRYEDGISTSLRRGLSALPKDADGVVVCLGNDLAPSSAAIDALIAAFDPKEGRAICMPVREGRRGNPLLIGRQFFAELHDLEGDIGARYLVGAYPAEVADVVVDKAVTDVSS